MKAPQIKSAVGLLAHGLPEEDTALITAAIDDPIKVKAVRAEVLKLAGLKKLDANEFGKWLALLLQFAPQILTLLKGA